MLRVARFAADCSGVPPKNNLSHHFEKYLHDMDLKLTEETQLPFFISIKPGEIPIFWIF